ncbi:MAG: hypothetical protein LUF29_08965 [Oscillospiraceae bacterium]|nr:hypothetical protein [Oscillospiraceae bacterium]
MQIVQDAFLVPDDIATGLATGLYGRFGSAIRYATGPNRGQFVKHLDSIDMNTVEQAQVVGSKALRFVQQHKKGVTATAVGAIVIGTGIGAGIWRFYKWKNHEPKVLINFRAALKPYIDAIREGTMDSNKISRLMEALEALKRCKDYEEITIQLTAEEFEVLVERIYQYTIKLASDNLIELSNDELQKNESVISNLQTYLKAQKRIFEKAA